MFGLPMEVVTMFISTIGSAYIRLRADKNEDLRQERVGRLKEVQAARKDKSPHAAYMRKLIVIALFGMTYVGLIAPWFGLPTVIPVEVNKGINLLLFEFVNTTTEFIVVEKGVVIPEYLPHAMMAVVGYYFGNATAKRY